jgi:hypothetical protein
LYGSGFTASNPKEVPVFVKFGVISSEEVVKSQVSEESWSDSEYHTGFNTPASLLKLAEKNDAKLDDGFSVEKYMSAVSPDISNQYAMTTPDIKGIGGPVYVQIGEKVAI